MSALEMSHDKRYTNLRILLRILYFTTYTVVNHWGTGCVPPEFLEWDTLIQIPPPPESVIIRLRIHQNVPFQAKTLLFSDRGLLLLQTSPSVGEVLPLHTSLASPATKRSGSAEATPEFQAGLSLRFWTAPSKVAFQRRTDSAATCCSNNKRIEGRRRAIRSTS